jgi:hypothetical protein
MVSELFSVHIENFGNGLHRLLYISRICGIDVADLDAEIENIVDVSIRKNAPQAITGLLLAHEGYFVQTLEGSHATISDLVSYIAEDARHTDLKVLMIEPIAARAFGRWSMRAIRRPVEPVSSGFNPYALNPRDLAALLSLSAVVGGGVKRRRS